MLVDGIAGGLHDKDVDAAHVLEQLEVDFAIGKALQLGLADRNADVAADLFSQRPVGRAAEKLEALVLAEIAGPLALRCRFGVLGLRVRGLAWGWAAYSRSPVPGVCLSSNVTVTVPTSISDYLQAGWLWLHSGRTQKNWLGD